MSEFNTNQNIVYVDEGGFRQFLTGTFTNMAIGLLVSAGIAFMSFQSLINGGFIYSLITSGIGFYVLLFGQLGVAIAFSAGLNKFNPMVARILFMVYSAITGVTFGILPIAYGVTNTFMAFVFTSVLFVCMAIIGKTTKIDISRFSGLLVGGLFALIIISIASMFMNLPGSTLLISYLGVIIFLGLTAWDVQKLKAYYYSTEHDEEMRSKLSIYGAFQLYLDFINLFLYILRIFGNRSRD
ncbi:MAG TPA: BAX inhibitor (BI)-1/YccA family protein [Erysipelotrichaceae bacterium]|nr:BAX inhibitor (BI)-1/YccA family protein [Erysipelotrichaceae bacterium]